MIYIAGDKQGFPVISFVMEYLTQKKFPYTNLGVPDAISEANLETFLPEVATKVLHSTENCGIVSCGTGVGVEVGINKFSGIRACLANEPKIAKWGKVYDNCNVLCIPAWETSREQVNSILDAWFSNQYDGDEKRLQMFATFDSWK